MGSAVVAPNLLQGLLKRLKASKAPLNGCGWKRHDSQKACLSGRAAKIEFGAVMVVTLIPPPRSA
jgi:hypothetical protein